MPDGITSVLIANRGEIAVRVIRAAKELGLRAVAVYSELDRASLHVRLADEAWNIGPAPAADSYLNVHAVLEAAAAAKVDAVHPGYGFLAENAGFAAAVIDEGLVFVGPPPDAIATMGDKIASRRAADRAGVAAVPGTVDPLNEPAAVVAFGAEHGYPLAIKAAHGGGGRGLRVVRDADEVEEAFVAASREADAYFSSPEVYVERYLSRARHIEAQILFDNSGHGVFLGERDCSPQRRHQKLIEEAPAPHLKESVREGLGAAALAVARACGYTNAGTVEFLVDADDNFYFLEMNTRLQVEHTVTEMVTGIDLVKEQFLVAAGEPLTITDAAPTGHAIQFRINAENPATGFSPTPGIISEYREPGGFAVRVDSGYHAGDSVSQYYDNLVAKLVVWGRDRTDAISRARRALAEFRVAGIATTIPAHQKVLSNETFLAGEHHTRFIEEEIAFDDLEPVSAPGLPSDEEVEERQVTVEVGGRRYVVRMWVPESTLAAASGVGPRRRPPRLTARATGEEANGVVVAPMQGTIIKVLVTAGEAVRADQTVCILEAMKMENEVKSPVDGEVVDLRVQVGDSVAGGAVVAIVR